MLILVYAFWQSTGFGTKKTETSNSQVSEIKKETDCNHQKPAMNFPLLSIPFMPISVAVVKNEDIKLGEGEGAVCGQHVKLQYEYVENGSSKIEKDTKDTFIGEGKLLKGIELGLIGMKARGERKISITKELLYYGNESSNLLNNGKTSLITATAKIDEITPSLPISEMPIHVSTSKMGSSKSFQCGDKIAINLTIWKLDGSKIFSTDGKAISFTIGESKLPFAIERTVDGMLSGGEATIIIPPALSKLLIKENTSLIPIALPENEIIVAKINIGEAIQK